MDPYATLAIWADAESTEDERTEAFDNLVSWINRGGFAPHDDPAWGSFLEVAYEA